ncbi:cytochrome c/c1 heme-lyase [Delphinella strobiligena]|nr:cytochrome c/c1 heme-lyase [Delphinella strobiligena]
MDSRDEEAKRCPVDHKTRQAWLDKAREANASKPQQPLPPNTTPTNVAAQGPTRFSLDVGRYVPVHAPPPTNHPPNAPFMRLKGLGTDREISTIPRAQSILEHAEAANTHSPANYEQDTGADAKSGNWVYPSEQMFFQAMKRKNFNPEAEDMKSIVPIHNAVNERAWVEIKKWEKGRGSEKCGGPKLVSFRGDSTALTPRARINSMLGYTKPFDRHDWVIDRCGTQVEYVIDFYAGKNEGKAGKALNFFLDVRPKLNTLEGWKMRAGHVLGL